MMLGYRVLAAGDTALAVEFGEDIDRKISTIVLALARRLNATRLVGIVETVPTFRSLMVHYDPLVLPMDALAAHIGALMQNLDTAEAPGRRWRLPACYDASLAPDLHDVAARTGLTPAQVVERHSAVTYHVYTLGFQPGFAYLGDVPPELVLPRREIPRPKIPGGSLAIAAKMTAIYPLESPAGWHLIGRSPVPLWEPPPKAISVLAPGDKVVFAPISLREYEKLQSQAAEGAFKAALLADDEWPDETPAGMAA
jgi:KipI family sensor histidine kinase inhibitor